MEHFSLSYLRRIRTAFYLLDFNKDGVLNHKDMRAVRKKSYGSEGLNPEKIANQAAKLWELTAPGGSADFEQFFKGHLRYFEDDEWRKELETAYLPVFAAQFKAIDFDKNGIISPDEYQKHIRSLLNNPDNAEEIATKEFNIIDLDRDGKITLDEFIAFKKRYFLTDDASDPIEMWGWLMSDEEWDNYSQACKNQAEP